MPDRTDIRLITQAPEKDLETLYSEAGWIDLSEGDHGSFLSSVVINSALFAGVFDGSRLIGMGRALSDLCSDAYIQDVTVLKPYRNQGIGRRIVEFLVRELKKKGVDWIGLVAEPGTRSFYEDIGFEPLPGYFPLKYKDR